MKKHKDLYRSVRFAMKIDKLKGFKKHSVYGYAAAAKMDIAFALKHGVSVTQARELYAIF